MVLDPKQRTYSEVTTGDMRNFSAELQDRFEQGRKQVEEMTAEERKRMLDGMTPEHRRGFEAFMARRSPVEATGASEPAKYEPIGEGETVAGFPCEWYREVRRGVARTEICCIPWGTAVSKHEMATAAALFEFLVGMTVRRQSLRDFRGS